MDLKHPEEERLTKMIDQEKISYKRNFEELKELKVSLVIRMKLRESKSR